MTSGHAAPFLIDMFVYRMITLYCTKFDRLTNRKFMEIVGTRGQILMAKCTRIDFGWGSAPDPARGAYDAPPDSLVRCGGGIPPPHTLPHRRLDPRAFGARLGAWGASTPRSSRLRRSAASQRLKPTLLLPSGAATDKTDINVKLCKVFCETCDVKGCAGRHLDIENCSACRRRCD